MPAAMTLGLQGAARAQLDPLAAVFDIIDGRGSPQRIDIDYLTPPGQLYDVGSHRLHMFCAGRGTPTIVFESGLGGFSLEWLTLQQQLAGSYRVCAYDRAGYGWSEFGPVPRTATDIATELDRLLRSAGEAPPYLLVGHSFGGYIVQAFARRWPELVAGLVLVDSSHPEQDRYLPPPPRPRIRVPGARMRTMSRPIVPPGYPDAVRAIAYNLMGTRKAARTQREELRHMARSGREVLAAGPVPDNLAVRVISRSFDRTAPGHSADEGLERTWQSLQSNLGLLYNAVNVAAEYSGHFVHLDQPWLVIETIERTIEQACLGPSCVVATERRGVATCVAKRDDMC